MLNSTFIVVNGRYQEGMNSSQVKFAANLIVGGKDFIMQAIALSGGYSNKIQPGQHKLIRAEEIKKRVAAWQT